MGIVRASHDSCNNAVAGSLVGGLFGPPGVLLYGLIPYLLLVGIPRLIGKGWAVWTRHGV